MKRQFAARDSRVVGGVERTLDGELDAPVGETRGDVGRRYRPSRRGAIFRRLVVGAGLIGVGFGGAAGFVDPAPFAALNSLEAQQPPAAPPAAAPPAVARWLEELDSDQFLTREAAMTKLIDAGAASVPPLVERIGRGNLELASRGVHVLRELALSTDLEVEEAARGGLEQLARMADSPAARRAESTLEALNETRQKRAIDELSRLGAKVGAGQVQFQLGEVQSVLTIEIGADWRGELQDLRRLRWLVGVQHVKFAGGRVTDEWMSYLTGMTNLTTLTLKRTGVSDDGLAAIRNLPKLQSVWVMYSPLTDRSVEHLRTLKQASFIKLYGTKITKPGVQQLTEALDGAKIDYRQGGFLGVNCQAHPLGCEVIVVQPGTAASDAGLESSDVILQYGSKSVESFETLTTHISENAPGEQIKLEIVRNVRLRRNGLERAAEMKLGIAGKANALGVELTSVEADSFAARLDLKPGDVVTGCGETRIRDLAGLEAAYAQAPAGERLDLDYVRAAQLVTKTVTLGEWE